MNARKLLPAPAGMVPRTQAAARAVRPAPRARGDGPGAGEIVQLWPICSPRPRGWSPWRAVRPADPGLLPAPAGMVPSSARSPSASTTAPRARGDGPTITTAKLAAGSCSPRPRGWSPSRVGHQRGDRLLPAPAGMVPSPGARFDRPSSCSPRPRGWSRAGADSVDSQYLLPAPAGMVPAALPPAGSRKSAPRARGDGPARLYSALAASSCSPRPRGWSLLSLAEGTLQVLLPAPAGMVRTGGRRWAACCPAPRARGDGPRVLVFRLGLGRCSPRPRGWSQRLGARLRGRYLLPAPAGMVPTSPSAPTSSSTAPRARGDGPAAARAAGPVARCSPRPRGWSLSPRQSPAGTSLLPAPAGMVPRRAVRKGVRGPAPRARGDRRFVNWASPCACALRASGGEPPGPRDHPRARSRRGRRLPHRTTPEARINVVITPPGAA